MIGLIPFPQLGFVCSPANTQRAVLALSTTADSPSTTSTFSGELLRPGRYGICFCQANDGACSNSNPAGWATFVGTLHVIDVPARSQKLGVNSNSLSAVTVSFGSEPLAPGSVVMDRFYAVAEGQDCGVVSSVPTGIEAITPVKVPSENLGEFGLQLTASWLTTPGQALSICYCNVSIAGQQCSSNGVDWQTNYGGPVASVLVHDVALSYDSVAAAASQTFKLTYAATDIAGWNVWFQDSTEECLAVAPSTSGFSHSSSSIVPASASSFAVSFQNTLTSKNSYRLCTSNPSAAPKDFANVGVYLPDLVASPVQIDSGSSSNVAMTFAFQASLEAGDKVWFRAIGSACGYPVSSPSSTGTEFETIVDGTSTYNYQFQGMPVGSKARVCIRKTSGLDREYPGITVQVLDTSLTLSSNLIQPGVVTLVSTFSGQALSFGDKVWFARADQDCGEATDSSIYRTPAVTVSAFTGSPLTLSFDFTTITGAGLTDQKYRMCAKSNLFSTFVLDMNYAGASIQINSFHVKPTSALQGTTASIAINYGGALLTSGSDKVWWAKKGVSCGASAPAASTATVSGFATAGTSGLPLSFNLVNVTGSATPFRLCVLKGSDSSITEWDDVTLNIVDASLTTSMIVTSLSTPFNGTISYTTSLDANDVTWWQDSGVPCNPHAPINSGSVFSGSAIATNSSGFNFFEWDFANVKASGHSYRLCVSSAGVVKDLSLIEITLNVGTLTSPPAAVPMIPAPIEVVDLPVYSIAKNSIENAYLPWTFTGRLAQYSKIDLVMAAAASCSSTVPALSLWASTNTAGGDQNTAIAGPINTNTLKGRYRMCFCQGSGSGAPCNAASSNYTQVGWLVVQSVPSTEQNFAVGWNLQGSFSVAMNGGPSPNATVVSATRFLATDTACGNAPTNSIVALYTQTPTSGTISPLEAALYGGGADLYTVSPAPTAFSGLPGVYRVCMCDPTLELGTVCPTSGVNAHGTPWYKSYGQVGRIAVHDVQVTTTFNQKSFGIGLTPVLQTLKLFYTDTQTVVRLPAQGWLRLGNAACGTAATRTSETNSTTSTPLFAIPASGSTFQVDLTPFANCSTFTGGCLLRMCLEVDGSVVDLANIKVQVIDQAISSTGVAKSTAASITYTNGTALHDNDVTYFAATTIPCSATAPGATTNTATAPVTFSLGSLTYTYDVDALNAMSLYRLCVIRGGTSLDFTDMQLTVLDTSVTTTATVVKNAPGQQILVANAGIVFGYSDRMWFLREDQPCGPPGASEFSSTDVLPSNTATGYDFSRVLGASLTKQKFRLCVQNSVATLDYSSVFVKVVSLSFTPKSFIAGSSAAPLRITYQPGGSLLAADKIWFRASAHGGSIPSASATDATDDVTVGASNSLLNLDLTNTVASQTPLGLSVYHDASSTYEYYSPYEIRVIDVTTTTTIITPVASTKINLTFTTASISALDLLWFQSADQDCLASAPTAPGTFHSATTTVATASNSNNLQYTFNMNGVQPPYTGAPFRLCVSHLVGGVPTIFDYDAVVIHIFGTPAPPTNMPTSAALPPTPVPAPTFSSSPTVQAPPTPAIAKPDPAVQVFNFVKSASQQFIEYTFTSGLLAYTDQLEILQGPVGYCGDGVTTPLVTFAASQTGTASPARSYPFLISSLNEGKYPLCLCYGAVDCATNLTAPRASVGFVIITDAVADQKISLLQGVSAQSIEVQFGFTPNPGADRLMLIPSGQECGRTPPAALIDQLGTQILTTQAVGGNGLATMPSTFAQTGSYSVCYCHSQTESGFQGCPISGEAFYTSYGGKVADVVIHDMKFRDSDAFDIISNTNLEQLTMYYDATNPVYDNVGTFWFMQASQACGAGNWGSAYDTVRSPVMSLPESGAVFTMTSWSMVTPSKSEPFRVCLGTSNGRVLDLSNTGVYVSDVKVTGATGLIKSPATAITIEYTSFGGSGDTVWFQDSTESCSLSAPSASASTTDAVSLGGGSATAYNFNMNLLAAQRVYRLCYAFNSHTTVLDLGHEIVPLTQAITMAPLTFKAEGNQATTATFSAIDISSQDKIWFQRYKCSSSPPQQAGTDYSAATFASSSLNFDFTGVSQNLEALKMCVLVAMQSPPTVGYTTNAVLEFAHIQAHVVGITTSRMTLQAGTSNWMTMAVLGNSLKYSDFLWFQKANEACATSLPSSSATTSTFSGYSPQSMVLDLTNTVPAAEKFRLCVSTLIPGDVLFGRKVADLDAITVEVIKLDIQTLSVGASAGQTVNIAFSNLTMPIGTYAAFVETEEPCTSVGNGVASQTPRVYISQDGLDGSSPIALTFNFADKKLSKDYRICALKPGASIYSDYSGETIAITGLSVDTPTARNGPAEPVVLSFSPGSVIPGAFLWFQSQAIACNPYSGSSWASNYTTSSPVELRAVLSATYTFDFSGMFVQKQHYKMCSSYFGTVSEVAGAKIHIMDVTTSSHVGTSTQVPVTLNYSYSSIQPGLDQVYFRRSDLECGSCPVGHSQSTPCTAVAAPLLNTVFDFTSSEGSQSMYRLCMFSGSTGKPIDLPFVTLRLVDFSLDVATVRSAPSQAVTITYSGTTLKIGDMVYFTSESSCSATPGAAASNSRQAVVQPSGTPLSFDFSDAVISASSWGMCVYSQTAGVLDYRSFNSIQIADVSVRPKHVSAVPSMTVKISSNISVADGDLMWFSANNPCVSPATAETRSASATSTNAVPFNGADSYAFDFSLTSSFGTSWNLCAGPAGSPSAAQGFDNTDCSVVVSDLAVTPTVVSSGSHAMTLTYTVGVLLPGDTFYFLDENKPCSASSSKLLPVPLSGSAIQYIFTDTPSQNRLRVCVARGGQAISFGHAYTHLVDVLLHTKAVKPEASQSVSLTWGKSLVAGDKIFFKSAAVDCALNVGETSTIATIPNGTAATLSIGFVGLYGDQSLYRMCVDVGGGGSNIVDYGVGLYITSAAVSLVMVRPQSVSTMTVLWSDNSLKYNDKVAWVSVARDCPTTAQFSAGVSASAETSNSVTLTSPTQYSFDMSLMKPTYPELRFRLCVAPASGANMIDYALIQLGYDVTVSPATVRNVASVLLTHGGALSAFVDRVVFVNPAHPCPTTGAAYSAIAGVSGATHSSLVLVQPAGVPVSIDFTNVPIATTLRMCVLHNELTSSYTDYPHVRIMTGTDSPTQFPTASPTASPSTAAPSTQAPVTGAPTISPVTGSPTVVTSSPVTQSPVNAPTLGPVTGSPTAGPTSGAPSIAPTAAPSTGAPTHAPVTKAPTAAPSASPSTSGPTSGAPTAVPTAAPQTGAPTRSPATTGPTKAGQTFSPSTGSPTPVPIYEALSCEGSPLRMLCPAGTSVHVKTAVYGRTDKYGGSPVDEILSGSSTTGCGTDRDDSCILDVAVALSGFCAGKDVCAVPNGQLDTFFMGLTGKPDPCPETSKYLDYTYSCY
jgi:hypothetical protein